jgi:tRNA threonylcarbamoyladenosine biosynthesis protein TsaE
MKYSEADVEKVAKSLLEEFKAHPDKATILALQGELGAGKTTLTKAIAKQLGITETVISPTFVIAKFYDTTGQFKRLAHIDAYRIESEDELAPLRWQEMLAMPETLIIIEWPERISGSLPEGCFQYRIEHDGDSRSIKKYE